MTESEWNSCTDPQAMLDWLRKQGTLSERKTRLFAVACCRRIWPLFTDERSRQAVEVVERYVEGKASDADLERASAGADSILGADAVARHAAASAASAAALPDEDFDLLANVNDAAEDASWAAYCTSQQAAFASVPEDERTAALYEAGWDAGQAVRDAERCLQGSILRDVVGKPFHPPSPLDPAWLVWNNGTVVKLAQSIYEDRRLPEGILDNGRLAILADALEEVGCADADLLDHLRGPGPHVRGCWVLDFLLGKT